jgi:hypothetical protein
MPPNSRLIAYGAIVAMLYMTIVSSLDGISKLIIACSLAALVAIIEKRARRRCCRDSWSI